MKLSIIVTVRNGEDLVLRALRSIPVREDIEIIVVDDCSEDTTYSLVETYKYYSGQNIKLVRNNERKWASGAMNVGLDLTTGEYITQLDFDDYYDTKKLNELLDLDRKEDLIFFWLQVNNGNVWKPEYSEELCDHICLYKREVIGCTRMNEKYKSGHGRYFHDEILSKNPSKYYHKDVVYFYNFPRENSNRNLFIKGEL